MNTQSDLNLFDQNIYNKPQWNPSMNGLQLYQIELNDLPENGTGAALQSGTVSSSDSAKIEKETDTLQKPQKAEPASTAARYDIEWYSLLAATAFILPFAGKKRRSRRYSG